MTKTTPIDYISGCNRDCLDSVFLSLSPFFFGKFTKFIFNYPGMGELDGLGSYLYRRKASVWAKQRTEGIRRR